MFQVRFYKKQERDKQQESNQHAVTSLIMHFVQFRVFAIRKDRSDDKCD